MEYDYSDEQDVPMVLVGHWWVARGRHGQGFHRFDAANMSREEAQTQAKRLLPTITDDQVRAMAQMLEATDG
jgi:hypothetical protein